MPTRSLSVTKWGLGSAGDDRADLAAVVKSAPSRFLVIARVLAIAVSAPVRSRSADAKRERARPADLARGPCHRRRVFNGEPGDLLEPDFESDPKPHASP